MAEATQRTEKLDSYTYLAKSLGALGQQFGDLPFDKAFGAFTAAGGYNYLMNWPDIQNRRVKSINTRPADYSKSEIEQMVLYPGENEQSLRAVSAGLASSTKTYDLIMQLYQDILTYYWYVYPSYTYSEPDFATQTREYSLACKVINELNPKEKAHEIVGLCMQYGKVFYTPRISVDKSHNKVNYAFLQQLPTDWCKIVGYNNGPGKYTVAFNMLYFLRPGNDWRQYGDLFAPYMPVFQEVTETPQKKEKYVYSSAESIDIDRFEKIRASATAGSPQWANIGGEWFYWVTLPADKVFAFEISDRSPYVVPPTTGMMVSMTQIPNYEAAQMEIVLNPLTSVLTGSLETWDPRGTVTDADPIRVSPTVRKLFEALWYQMLDKTNTSGIGLFLAPANDMKLQTLSDTVANTNIASMALNDQVLKAGLPSLIPTTADPKVGVAQLSATLHAEYPKIIYTAMEKVMNWVLDGLKLKTPLRFKMFGDIYSRKDDLEEARKGMTLGILVDTLKYDAMQGHSLLEDIAVSKFIKKSGVLDMRIPLVSTYSAKQSESSLPPQAKQDLDPGGRPPEDGSINSEVTEKLNAIAEALKEISER